eukprot:10548000-Lingulodinium_polyedra.AAC.1
MFLGQVKVFHRAARAVQSGFIRRAHSHRSAEKPAVRASGFCAIGPSVEPLECVRVRSDRCA